jgi:hypothetical protein
MGDITIRQPQARDYDWRKIEARLNALPQFHTDLNGLGIYFLHIRSPHSDAAPLILNRLDRGGHFAAFEQPDLFVKELRACFGKMRAM